MPAIGLRARIAAVVAFVVLATVAVAFVAVYRESSAQLTRRGAEDVQQDIAALAQIVSERPRTAAAVTKRVRSFFANPPFRPTNHIAFVAIEGRPALTNQPELLGATDPEPGESAGSQTAENSAAKELLAARVGVSTHTLPDAGRLRVRVQGLRLADGRVVRLGIGEPTTATDRAEHSVRDAFLLAGVLATLAALLGGVLVATRFVSPLQRMAAVAASVDSGELHRRMHFKGRQDEISVLAESFNHMLDRLQGAFDRQSDFVADASHELRTPITVIRGQLEVLARQRDPGPTEIERVERLVRTEVVRMERLVEDLLLLAQADADGFVRPVDIYLPKFLDDLLRGQEEGHGRSLRLTPPPEITIRADPDRLAQALRNLLNNAIAHTAPDGQIEFGVQEAGRRLRFFVEDDGPGVPPAERERVFERFHRLDRQAAGAGLGLAIVSAVAEAHGGRAYVEDSPLGGARFVIDIAQTPGATSSS